MLDFNNSLVVGIDVHKRSHTAVMVNPFCQVISSYTFNNSTIITTLKQIQEKAEDKKLIFALEDVYGNGLKLCQQIKAQGFDVYSVPSNYTERERQVIQIKQTF